MSSVDTLKLQTVLTWFVW